MLSGEVRVELSRRERALIDHQSLEGGEPPLVVASEVLRLGKTLHRPPDRILCDAEHRHGLEHGREHARLPWLMEHRLVGLDRDWAEPLPHAAHVVHWAVHGKKYHLRMLNAKGVGLGFRIIVRCIALLCSVLRMGSGFLIELLNAHRINTNQ